MYNPLLPLGRLFAGICSSDSICDAIHHTLHLTKPSKDVPPFRSVGSDRMVVVAVVVVEVVVPFQRPGNQRHSPTSRHHDSLIRSPPHGWVPHPCDAALGGFRQEDSRLRGCSGEGESEAVHLDSLSLFVLHWENITTVGTSRGGAHRRSRLRLPWRRSCGRLASASACSWRRLWWHPLYRSSDGSKKLFVIFEERLLLLVRRWQGFRPSTRYQTGRDTRYVHLVGVL